MAYWAQRLRKFEGIRTLISLADVDSISNALAQETARARRAAIAVRRFEAMAAIPSPSSREDDRAKSTDCCPTNVIALDCFWCPDRSAHSEFPTETHPKYIKM